MHSKKIVIFRSNPVEEKRVALTPATAKKLAAMGWHIHMESQAGAGAGFPDSAYEGVVVDTDIMTLAHNANLVLCLGAPTAEQVLALPESCAIVGLLGGALAPDYMRKRPSYGLERLPRTSGAQIMDVLTSQSSLYGYWSVLDGARRLPRVMPMMSTPSGRLNPAQVLVLGAGVAGLQAMATAKRLGAVVSAFDVRESARGAVESLDCQFYRVSDAQVAASEKPKGDLASGYAHAVDGAMLRAQQNLIATLLPQMNMVIATALVPGQEPPVLITKAMAETMAFGSVIMDLATDRLGAPLGAPGNCAISHRGHEHTHNGVTIVGPSYGLSHMALDASTMYANNLVSFIQYAWNDTACALDETLDLVHPLRLGGTHD